VKNAGSGTPRDTKPSPQALIARIVAAPRPRPGRRKDVAGQFIDAVEDDRLRARLASLLKPTPKALRLITAILD
jgi:hypothetical protein